MPKRTPDWKKGKGILPAVVQDAESGHVLMLGYMSLESLKKTKKSKEVVFFSRSKNRLWKKGETSGNILKLVSISLDCDGDTFLIQAHPKGPACHLETRTCFDPEVSTPGSFLSDLEALISSRFKNPPKGSYVAKLIQEGSDRMAQKVGEEAIEAVIASKNKSDEKFLGECADLLFHLIVLLKSKKLSLRDVTSVLEKRRK